MSGNTNVFCILIVLCSLSEGQKYLLGEPDTDDYFSDQDEFTNPPASFHQSTLLSNGDYYIRRDLETSEIPVHLQETLPQYQQHIIPKQNFHLNRPAPFKPSNEYVKPSTHRPDYSHVLPHHFHREQLKQQVSDKRTANNQLEISSSDLEELSGNEFETEKPTKKLVTNLSLTNTNSIISPLSDSNKENSNHVDTHFNKRDSKEEETKDRLNESEYLDEPEDQISDSETKPESSDDKSNEKQNNELEEPEYDEEYEYDEDEENEEAEPEIDEDDDTKNDTYELLTMKPVNTSQDSMFNEFVDVESMDTTTQEPATSNILTQPPIILPKNKGNDDVMKDFPELVVSVVTSKTIENNTIIAPVSHSQLNTSTESDMPVENSTDSWIVIASVQTSRSISGTRYIPSSVIDQDERIQLLNEPNAVPDLAVREDKDKSSETYSTSSVVSSTSVKTKTSTESLIDKLDRVQSDLSSGLLTGGFKNDNIAVIEENLSTKVETTTEDMTTTPMAVKNVESKPYPQVNIRKFNAGNRPLRPKVKTTDSRRKGTIPTSTAKSILEQKDALSSILQKVKPVEDISALLPPGYKLPSSTEANTRDSVPVFGNPKSVDDISAFLPPGYKPSEPPTSTAKVDDILSKAKPVNDISALLPPGYKVPQSSEKTVDNILSKAKPVDDIGALLPPGYKPTQSEITEKTTKNILSKAKPEDDISALLPPGYKSRTTTSKSTGGFFNKVKPVDDISALLPPGYKPSQSGTTEKTINNLLSKAKPVEDISALLPPGYKNGFTKPKVTTASSIASVVQDIPANLLPPGFNRNGSGNENPATSTVPSTSNKPSSTSGGAVKLVFPSRPGGGSRKTPRLTTPRVQNEEVNKVTVPTIQKGWPVRASTEFTGWPTPSTTPISIEKLLEAARKAATSTTTEGPTEPSSTTTTTTTTTTTARPTTPGICIDDCDLAGTIKLVGGAKWVPELLDPNTKEYQILSNSVQTELVTIYSNSPALNKWYKQIRIDGFSEGSILVDYLVEFDEIGQKLDTQEIKRLFHESLTDLTSNREGKSLNESKAERFSLGQFEVDPKYTDFIVIPKNAYPTVGYAEDVLLPQWAIAVIVIGLASLLFVIIFGVTVLFNRHKNSKKTPAPLTEDMLNELNKNHMGGLENYGVDDFYNMEDVWSDKHYEQKPHKKRNNGSSVYDNSTANLYDSWRSQWNGQWNAYNTYYGHPNSSQHSGHSGLRRPDHDTNF